MPTAVTGNALKTGEVVFLTPDGSWSGNIDEALVAEGEPEVAALVAQAESAERAGRVVGPYPIDVTVEGHRVRPVRYRELLRTLGPSVRRDLGKQSER